MLNRRADEQREQHKISKKQETQHVWYKHYHYVLSLSAIFNTWSGHVTVLWS